MEEEKKNQHWPYILIGILFSACLGLAIWSIVLNKNLNSLSDKISEQELDIRQEVNTIDSLEKVIKEKQGVVDHLRDSVKNIKEKVIIREVERISHLPVDSNVSLLKENIEKHGIFTQEDDTLPKIMSIDNDTVIALSENNVKDINSIVVNYEWVKVENSILEDIIAEDSTIICNMESIMFQKDIIISKQDSIHSLNMKRMEQQIKKDKAISGAIGAGFGAATVAVIVLGVILGTR